MVETEKITTIKVDRETKDRLDKLKIHHKESYDEIIQKMLHILNICKVSPDAARSKLLAIDNVKRLQEREISKKPNSAKNKI